MDRPKFKPVLQERIAVERRIAKEQEQLRKKYNLPAKKYIEVHKEHLLTSLTKLIGRMLRLVILLILFSLAFAGAVAILYPESRAELLYVYQDVVGQLNDFFYNSKR